MERSDDEVKNCDTTTPPARAKNGADAHPPAEPKPNDDKKRTFTPAAIRSRKFRKEFKVSSPSDALMSPCTQRLFGKGVRTKASHPTAVLKEKQKEAISNSDCSSEGSNQTPDSSSRDK